MRHILTRTNAFLLFFAIVSGFFSAGCAPALPPEPDWEKDARLLLDQAEGQFSGKQYDLASKTVEAFFGRYQKSRNMDKALYLAGELRLTLREFPRALSYYKELIEKFPGSALILDARYKLGLCYFEVQEYDLAIANLEDRSRISDPARLKRISEVLSAAYVVKKRYPAALREYALLVETTPNEKQKSGYRDRVRDIIDKNLAEDELKTLAQGSAYPSDIALLRLATTLMEQRQYRETMALGKVFLERFPAHPEKTRAEMLMSEAASRLAAPRYTMAALVPQTGQLAFFGDRVLKGIQLAIHTYNVQDPDNRVELIVKDTEGSPEKTVAVFTELAGKNIVAAIGPLLTKDAEALAPVLDKFQIPAITPAASGEGIGKLSPWLFRNALTNTSQATFAAQYALSLKLKKFVIFYPDDAYGRDLSRLFTKELEKNAEILASIAYPPDANDFGPYIKRIIETDLRSRKIPIPEVDEERKKLFQEYVPGFDAIYLPGYAEKIGLLIPQLAFYNITSVTRIGTSSWHSPDLIERAGRHADGAVFTDGFFPESADPAIKTTIDAYRSAYQEEPDILSAQAYDAAAMILSLIKDRKDTPVAIRDGLLALKDYPGISGATTFSGNRDAQKKLFLIKIEDGGFVLQNN